MIKIQIVYDGRTLDLTWINGKLEGDHIACMVLECHAPYRTVGLGGGPYYSGADILAHPTATFLLAYELFGGAELIEGELPAPPPIPDGAIA